MRKIKFRAWDKRDNTMMSVGQTMNNADIIFDPEADFEVMQFTGLHDKNGKEIFEGDIVEGTHGVKAIIEWTQEFGRWSMRWSDRSTTPIAWHVKHAIVIGNIHEGGLSDAELRENF